MSSLKFFELMVVLAHVIHEPIFNICFANVRGSWIVWLNGILFNAIIITLLMWAWLSTPRYVGYRLVLRYT